jgi:glycosyltransferase involved in cell wall biosynthesis
MQYFFKDITLLITHYNRSESLHRLLAEFKKLSCEFGAIVVSDDGSTPMHQEELKKLQIEFDFALVGTDKNQGLGNNINKGQDQVKTAYTLYVQEDFIPLSIIGNCLSNAQELLLERPDIDMVRFYAYFKYPYLAPIKNGFSEMKFGILKKGYNKFYYYSDHPHLRKSDFLQKFGRYSEGKNPEVTEYDMMFSFLLKGGKAMYFDRFQDVFIQKNTTQEPSTMVRGSLRESDKWYIFILREMYRHVKFNMSYFFHKK